MEKQTVFIKRYPSKGELPKVNRVYWCKFKDFSDALHQQEWVLEFGGFGDNECYDYWLEEIELPSGEFFIKEVKRMTNHSLNKDWIEAISLGYLTCANFILNKLKGE